MYTYKNAKNLKNTFTCDIFLNADVVSKEKNSVLAIAAKNVSVPGFRKGHAPVAKAAEYLSESKIAEQVLKNLLPTAYSEIIKKENLKPISDPHITIKSTNVGQDWEITFALALFPDINLGNYKSAIAKLKKDHEAKLANVKQDESTKESEDTKKAEKSQDAKSEKLSLDAILEELLRVVELEVSDILVNEESNSRLGRLYQDVQKTGVSFEKYLESKKLTEENLIKNTKKQSEDTYKIEFIMGKIAETEDIEATDEDLAPIRESLGKDANADQIERSLSFYKNFIKKQKVLDFLQTL